MFDQFMWIPFLAATTVLTLTPGVDTLLVMRNSARGGHRNGLLTSLGICLGLFVHAMISAAGLSAILMGSAELFTALKLAGAGYLVYLGLQSLRSAYRAESLQFQQPNSQRAVPVLQSLREGALCNILNPKPIVFYMAFLPQFIDPLYPAIPQALLMAVIHFSVGMLWQSLLALCVYRAKIYLQRPRVQRVLDSVSGLLLLGFGVKLGSMS